ncbi:unnamed protein product [Musa acuminata subsp. malaccensis]|uniref:(wild Malaysian banana) hypothetical protein n=1 Tax=Musa acuminata subsp. malaccensis TaxID=214687 RepID=A0A804L9D8_MUSAM|nr:unnamed protein product [Musa acuminata subsp. malaccensis]
MRAKPTVRHVAELGTLPTLRIALAALLVTAISIGSEPLDLQALGHIRYDALRRDTVPCSRRGASYYNFRPVAEANPYSDGFSAITRCHGG